MGILILLVYYFYLRIKYKSQYDGLKFATAVYTYQAQNTYHNIKDHLGNLMLLLIKKEFAKALEYANKASLYVGYAMNTANWEAKNWSLKDELNFLYAYKEARSINLFDIDIKVDLAFIADTSKVVFIPDLFVTLLQNSIKHGYKEDQTYRHFTINFSRENNKLIIEVKDNGDPDDNVDFMKKHNRISGLNILNEKIWKIWMLSKTPYRKYIKYDFFQVKAKKNIGTTVKIILPYEEMP